MATTDLKTDFAAGDSAVPLDLTFRPAAVDVAKTLRPDQVEMFNRDGFIGALPVFNPDEAADLRSYIDELVDNVVSADDRRNSYSINAYHMVCEQLYDTILTPAILDHAQDIIGADVVAWGTQLFRKLPHDPKEIPFRAHGNNRVIGGLRYQGPWSDPK